jgi:hypothetical protein
MSVNKERVQLWVDALRSGKYNQGDGALRIVFESGVDEKFCCLGVACDISGVGEWEFNSGTEIDEAIYYSPDDKFSNGNRDSSILTGRVAEWFGFNSKDPNLIDEDGDYEKATALNDSHGYTFEEIADAIERTFLNDE